MQNILRTLLDAKGSTWSKTLGDLGLESEQARSFLPKALASVLSPFSKGDLGPVALAAPADLKSIRAAVDVDELATASGLDPAVASRGLDALLPEFVTAIAEKIGRAGSLSALLPEGGDLMSGFGNLAGKLLR